MKKSKNQRKNDFLQRIKIDEVNKKAEKIKDNDKGKELIQEAPSIISQRILLRRVRGHIGKAEDEELER